MRPILLLTIMCRVFLDENLVDDPRRLPTYFTSRLRWRRIDEWTFLRQPNPLGGLLLQDGHFEDVETRPSFLNLNDSMAGDKLTLSSPFSSPEPPGPLNRWRVCEGPAG